MSEQQTTYTGSDDEQLPDDTTPKADDAAAARIEDYEATVKWNEENRAKPDTGA